MRIVRLAQVWPASRLFASLLALAHLCRLLRLLLRLRLGCLHLEQLPFGGTLGTRLLDRELRRAPLRLRLGQRALVSGSCGLCAGCVARAPLRLRAQAPPKERTPGARPRAHAQREWAWIGILDMRIELGRQQFKLLWAADESGTMWEPSWAFAACMNMTGETLEEVAVHNRVDENDPSVLANDALVNALMEAAPADGDRVLVEKKGGLAAGKLVGAYAEGEQISVLFDGNKKASACAAASLVSLAPPRRATIVANAPVRAIYPADDGHRQWFYGVVERAASAAELVTVKFDDGSVSAVAVYDVQCALTNNWLGDERS
jgi:hypothetical protein